MLYGDKYKFISNRDRTYLSQPNSYLMPGNLDKPHDDRGRLSVRLSTKLSPWSFGKVFMSMLLVVFVIRRWDIGLFAIGEWDPWPWWLSCFRSRIHEWNVIRLFLSGFGMGKVHTIFYVSNVFNDSCSNRMVYLILNNTLMDCRVGDGSSPFTWWT